MADFVAVIRKAVDGLANNTPENRAKVYDKARSAVVRQLENMKPRPPEELLRRQIAKLDAAIAEVDSEYAEALPALEDDDAISPAAEETAASYYQQDAADADEARAAEPVEQAEQEEERHEPVYEEPAPAAPAQPEPVYEEPAEEEEPRHTDTVVAEEQRHDEHEPEELYDAPETVHAAPAPAHVSDEAVGTYFTRADEEPHNSRSLKRRPAPPMIPFLPIGHSRWMRMTGASSMKRGMTICVRPPRNMKRFATRPTNVRSLPVTLRSIIRNRK